MKPKPLPCPLCGRLADITEGTKEHYATNPWAWLVEHLYDAHSLPIDTCFCGFVASIPRWYGAIGEHLREAGDLKKHFLMAQIANL